MVSMSAMIGRIFNYSPNKSEQQCVNTMLLLLFLFGVSANLLVGQSCAVSSSACTSKITLTSISPASSPVGVPYTVSYSVKLLSGSWGGGFIVNIHGSVCLANGLATQSSAATGSCSVISYYAQTELIVAEVQTILDGRGFTLVHGSTSWLEHTTTQGSQYITLPTLVNVPLGASAFSVSATATSNNPVSLSSLTTPVCTVSNNSITPVAAGTCTIQATVESNSNYAAAIVTKSFQVLSSQQVIFGLIADVNFGSGPVTLSATASSGLPVTVASATPSVCTVSGSSVTLVKVGGCTVTASQTGNANYTAAITMSQSFNIILGSQIISFNPLPNVMYGRTPATLSASSSSGLAVSFTSMNAAVCTVSANTVTLLAPGTCKIQASQAGNSNYAASTPVIQSFSVNPPPRISTIAGNRTYGYSGDGGPATSASFNQPQGLAVDINGNLYIADMNNGRIRKVTIGTGVITTVAGNGVHGYSGDGGPAISASLSFPSGVAVDGRGNLYIADRGNARIRKVDAQSGVITSVAGNGNPVWSGDDGPATSAGLSSPWGVAVDSAGNVYIIAERNWVRMVSAATGVITSNFFCVAYSNGIAADNRGNVYVSDLQWHRVVGQASAAFNQTPPECPPPIAVGASSSIGGYSGDGGAAKTAQLNIPTGLAVDNTGNLYIADYNNNRIRMVTAATGVITTVAGNGRDDGIGDGGSAISASLTHPTGVAIDSAGVLYIADVFNIRKVVIPRDQTITFNAPENVSIQTVSLALSATASSGLVVSLESTTPSVCTVEMASARIQGAGTCAITAIQQGNENYNAAQSVTQSFSITRAVQTIAFGAPGSVPFGSGPVTLSATANSGLPVSFASLTQLTCSVNSAVVTTIAAGTCSISATQEGNTNYSAALPVTRSFDIALGSQGITFLGPESVALSIWPVMLSATSASGLSVSFTSATTAVCTVTGSSVALLSTGVCEIQASQGGNSNYAPASPVVRRFDVTPGPRISTVAGTGQQGYSGDGGVATSALLSWPSSVAVDVIGNLVVADLSNQRIRQVAAGTGAISTVAGNGSFGYSGDGGTAINASLADPAGVAVDSSGNIYIADQGNNRIRMVGAGTGVITTVAGTGLQGYSGDGGLASSAELNTPQGIAVDTSGNLYIADSFNNAVRKVSSDTGLITTVAGNGSRGYSGDGGPATSAMLRWPGKVTLDGSGNLYIADSSNDRIRKVSFGTGVITTVVGTGIVVPGIQTKQ